MYKNVYMLVLNKLINSKMITVSVPVIITYNKLVIDNFKDKTQV